MRKLVLNYCEMPWILRKPMWRFWHRLINRLDSECKALFLNHGFAGTEPGQEEPVLYLHDEADRYSIQLYDYVARQVDISGKKVVEVGSGRGGGASYISRYFGPASYTGVDISGSAVRFCKRQYQASNLDFILGYASRLPLDDNLADIVISIDCSRCFRESARFFDQVYRVLHDDGKFLFADMIRPANRNRIERDLVYNGFRVVDMVNITSNIIAALEMDQKRRENLIREKVPGILSTGFHEFAGIRGSRRYEAFLSGATEYWSYVVEKAR